MELQPEAEPRSEFHAEPNKGVISGNSSDYYGVDRGPEKMVVRRGKLTSKGRSLSLSQVSTVDSATQGAKPAERGLFSMMEGLTKAVGAGASRMSSKTSVQTTSTGTSALDRPLSRPSSGNSRVLQGGGREVLTRRHTIEEGSLPGGGLPAGTPITRRHTIDESRSAPQQAGTPITRRHTIDEGSLPSRSQSNGAIERRPSDVALEASNGFHARKKSSLDMTPRTARKYRIHQHRLSLDGALDEQGHHHRDSRRGSHLGAESLAILAAKKYEEGSDDDVDPRWVGFRPDDRVTTADGPDADGPWKHMGVGSVVEPSAKKGLLQIYFRDARQTFGIRACNLLNITDPSRSGKYARPGEHNRRQREKAHPGSITKHEEALESSKARQKSTMAGLIAYQLKEQGIPAMEPTKFTFRDGLEASGLEVGDIVGSIGSRLQPIGVIVKEGAKPGDVLVRVGDLGVRCFPASELTKIEQEGPRDKEKAARRASYVNPEKKKSFTLSVDEAMATWSNEPPVKEKKVWKKAPEPIVEKKVQICAVTDKHCFVFGEFVKVKETSEKLSNPMWCALGLGYVRGPGERPGTVQVQFDSGSEAWTLFAEDLEHVDRSETTDRMFQAMNPSLMAKRRGSV